MASIQVIEKDNDVNNDTLSFLRPSACVGHIYPIGRGFAWQHPVACVSDMGMNLGVIHMTPAWSEMLWNCQAPTDKAQVHVTIYM